MNLWKQIKQERRTKKLEEQGLIDGSELLGMAINLRGASDEERIAFGKVVDEAFNESGAELKKEAIKNNILTEKDISDLKELGFVDSDFSTLISALKGKIALPDETPVMLTMPDSVLYKNKKYIQKKFPIMIWTPKELNEHFEQQSKI